MSGGKVDTFRRAEQGPKQMRLATRAAAAQETDRLVADVNYALALFGTRGDFSGKIGDLFGMDLKLTEPPSLDRAETDVS